MSLALIRCLCFHATLFATLFQLVSGDCIDLDLGMESLAIPDSRINSSSELNVNTPAKNGRLNFIAGSSWCASTNDSNPYLQIDLQTLHIICAVSTQGNSQGDQWVETYNLQTSVDSITWTDYEEFGQVKNFTGNRDRNTENKIIIYEGLLTRWLRFVVKRSHSNFCMRTEVFGVRQKSENLAAGKPTVQSSTYSDPIASGESYKAVDGNPDTQFENGHCTHTLQDNPSWWLVDLGSDHVPVSEIYIVNRFSPHPYIWLRNKDYKITLGDSRNVTTNPECVGRYSFIDFKASALCYNNPLRTGRYVGIMTTKRNYFQLCEVEVYSRENLAFGKPTDQSTTDHGGVSSRAVDGRSDTHYVSESCTHTIWGESNRWWRVDLGRVEPVTEVYIVNRGDCCGSMINPFEIKVGTEYNNGGLGNPNCGGNFSLPSGEGRSFFCRPSLHGRYVTIRNLNINHLTLCEVEVYSARRACPIQAIGLASSYTFPDNSFSASSSSLGKEASKGRLNGVGAWLSTTNDNASDYLQIDLQYEFFICAVATQGNPAGNQWTRAYKLLLSLNNTDWVTYQENNTDKIFYANSGRNDIVKHYLETIARARFIRFLPTAFAFHKALRVEVYGVLKPSAPSKAPTNFRVLPLTSSRVHASWQLSPADSTHGANIGFKLLYRKSFGAGHVTVITINDNSSVSIDVTGLEKFTEYEFQLLAFSSVGNGPKTSLQVVKTNEDVPSQAPIRFTVTADSSTSISATWQLPPADSRNGIIRGFKLIYREEDPADSQITTLAINDSTTYARTVSGLLRYTNYEFQVLAFTSVGDGPKSAAKVERTKEDAPSKAPASFTVTADTSTSITATWQAPPEQSRNGLIIGFKLFYKKKGAVDSSTFMLLINSSSILTKAIVGLDKFTEYEFQVLAFTAVGDGPKTSVRVERTKEDVPSQAPRSLTVTADSSTNIVAFWLLPPQDSRHGIIKGFKLFYTRRDPVGSPTIIIPITGSTNLTKNITGLDKYTVYEFQVLAFTSVGDGPKSSVKVERTKEGIPSKPPSNVHLRSTTSTSVTASWQLPPRDARNGIITGFKLFYKERGSASSPTFLVVINSGAIFNKTVTGLARNTFYEFQVLASTSVGDGPKSSVKVERTKEGDPPLVRKLPNRIIFRIGELAILTCEVKGATEPFVTWTKDRDTSIPRAKFQNNGRVLVIKSVLPRDSGLYECKASNEFGESSMSTTVVVVAPPVIVKEVSPPLVICERQSLCSLNCHANSEYTVTYSWVRNGEVLDSDNVQVMNNSVVVRPRSEQDYGAYVCNASNSFGSTTYIIILTKATKCSSSTDKKKEDENQHNLFRVATFSLSCAVALLLIVIGVLTWRKTRTASAKTSTPFKHNYNVDDSPHDEHLTEPVIFMELNTRLSDAQTSASPDYQSLQNNDTRAGYYNVGFNQGNTTKEEEIYTTIN